MLYCQVAPASSPVRLTLIVPLLVTPSLPEAPVSLAKAKLSAVGGVRSRVIAPEF